jgi:glycosyltransferase involved in cell wall biosynthesis
MSLRIGIFVALLPPEHQGGAELQADRMARELAKRGHSVDVFARKQPGRSKDEFRDGVRIHRRPSAPLPGLRLGAEVSIAVAQAARVRPEVLLCYITINSGLLGAATSTITGTPFVVWTRVEGESVRGTGSVEPRIAFGIYRRAAGVWVQADAFARTLREAYLSAGRGHEWERLAPRVRVIGNGVDMPPAPPPQAPAPPARFLFAGRLVDQKDLLTLVAAVRQLSGAAELWIAGDGPRRGATEDAARGAPVRFLGSVPHERIADLLRDCRALVLSSTYEGIPNVVLEALAHSRPVISTPVGAVPEFVRDGENGRIVPCGDIEGLAAAMRELLDDAAWRRLASNARAAVQRCSWPELVGQVESELAALVRVAGS